MSVVDAKVQELFNIVQERKKEIAKAEKPDWKTNSSFRYDQFSAANSINLQTISDINTIISIYAFLLEKEEFYQKACNDLFEKEGVFKWLGFTLEEWKSDLKTRLDRIQLSKKKADLELLEKRLDKLVSPELKTQLEIEEITKALKQN